MRPGIGKAGLRAGEIANLTWPMVTDPNGHIGTVIALEDRFAKKKSGRVIPLHRNRSSHGAVSTTGERKQGDAESNSIEIHKSSGLRASVFQYSAHTGPPRD